MALTFKKLREGILAQLNPFDNGKTFDTVSRGVQPTPSSQRQATAFNQPTQQVSFNGPQQNFQQQSAPKPTSFSQPSKPAVSFIQPTAQVNIPKPATTPQFQARPAPIGSQPVVNNIGPTTKEDYNKDPVARQIKSISTGIGRSLTGTVQSASGLVDAISPGKGTSQFTKNLNRNAEGMDQTVKDLGLNNVLYKGGQIGTDVATFLLPGAVAPKAVVKTGQIVSKVPGVTKATVKLAQGAKTLENTGKAGKTVVGAGKYLTRPDVIANVATDTALNTGFRGARGQDISPGTIAFDAATSAGTQGALTGIGKGIKYARDTNRYIDKFVNNYQDTQFGKYVSNKMAATRAADEQHATGMQAIQDAQDAVARAKAANEAYKAAMGTLDETQARIRAEQAAREAAVAEQIAAPHQQLLESGNTPNFTVNRLENERIVNGTAKLSKEYDKRVKAINKQFPEGISRNSVEYRNAIDSMEREFMGRYQNLENGVGEFAVQPTRGNTQAPSTTQTTTGTTKAPSTHDLTDGTVWWSDAKQTAVPIESMAKNHAKNAYNKLLKEYGQEGADSPLGQSLKARSESTDKPIVNIKEKPVVETKTPNSQTVKDATEFATNSGEIIKEPGRFKRAWASVNGIISSYGEVGKAIAKRLETARDNSEIYQQAFINKIPNVQALSKDEFVIFVRSLEDLSNGKTPNITPKIQEAIMEWNKVIPEVRDHALKAGLDVGNLGENYFPRFFKNEVQKKYFTPEAHVRQFGNLVKSRETNRADYEMTHDAMIKYINRAYDSIAKAEQLGPKGEIVKQAQEALTQQGINPSEHFNHFMDIALGNVDKGTGGYKAARAIKAFNAYTTLGLAGISNATQLTNTATKAGIYRTLKGIAKNVFDPATRQKAIDAGVLLDSSIKQMAEQNLGSGKKIASNIASPFFAQIEKFNRQVTGIVGADYGHTLAKKAASGNAKAAETLRALGVTGDIGASLTRSQEIEAARGLVKVSQFKVEPMDMPGWSDSALGTLAAQFRSFGYKQTGFMWNEVLRKALSGDVAPLSRFIAVGAPAGFASAKTREFLSGKLFGEDEENTDSGSMQALKAINTGVNQVGGYGLPGTAVSSMVNGLKYGTPASAAAGTIGGPTAGLILETITNVDKATGGKWQPLAKEITRKIPIVGRPIANNAFGKSEAQTTAGTTPKADASPAELDKQAKVDLTKLKTDAKTGEMGITQLVNGQYAYTINGEVKTTDKLKTAQQNIAKAVFGDSDENIKIIGETVYRKNAEGTISTMSKTKYDYTIGTQELEKYKRAEDLGKWNETANKQLDSIEKQLNDPNIDPLDRIQLENDAEALIANMKKYAGYGGFTKPKGGGYSKYGYSRSGGGGGGGGSSDSTGGIGNPYKYAVATSDGPAKTTVKIPGGSATKVGVARKAIAKPKVSLKKSIA